MYLRISCYCDACLNSSDLRVGVTTLLNTIQYIVAGECWFLFVISVVRTTGCCGIWVFQSKAGVGNLP